MKVKRSRTIVGLALVAVFMAAASVYSLFISYRAEVESHRRVLLARGQTVLDALKAGILAHGRMGRYRGERLAVIFDELARNPGIVALELRSPDGAVLASGGQEDLLPDVPPRRPHWTTVQLTMASLVDFRAEFGNGERRGWMNRQEADSWNEFVEGNYVLLAGLETAEVNQAIRRHQVQFAVSVAVISAALGLGTVAVVLLLKRAELASELEREREHAQRQEQIAQLGAGLAHETKNPLGIVRGLAQSIGDCSHHNCPIKDRAKTIVDEVDRVIGGINSFLALSRPQEAIPVPLDLDRFFEAFLPLVQMDAAAAKVYVWYEPSGIEVMADEGLLRRALLNLILNALRASKPGQTVRIETRRDGASLALRVVDTGCGIAPEDLPRVADPYFTRFPGGSGLGLSMVAQIAAAHGWRLSLASEPGQGTQAALEGLAIVEAS